VLRTYIRRNGSYRFDPLLKAIWEASSTPAVAASWVADLSSSAAEPAQFLAGIVNEDIVGPAERELLFSKLLALAQIEAERRAGESRNDARWRLQEYYTRYIRALLSTKQYVKAVEALRAIPRDIREMMRMQVIPMEIEIAAATNALDSVLTREDIESWQLQQAAASLRSAGEQEPARRILEALYTRELDRNNLDMSNFLGLAEVRLESEDTAGAVALLRRMTMVSGEPFEALVPAAELLARFGRKTEAIEFWDARVKAVPWDLSAATQLAIARNDVATLRMLASGNQTPYPSRVDAAKAIPGATGLGSRELDLLASSVPITTVAAEQPYFYHARLRAAGQKTDAAARIQLLRGAVAIDSMPVEPRVQLFRTLFEANQFEQALAVFRGQIPEQTPADRALLLRQIATAHRNLDQLDQARRYLTLLANAGTQQDVRSEMAAIETELKRREENRSRMPHIHDGVDQTQRVRPRV
jgi:hypothetical protein